MNPYLTKMDKKKNTFPKELRLNHIIHFLELFKSEFGNDVEYLKRQYKKGYSNFEIVLRFLSEQKILIQNGLSLSSDFDFINENEIDLEFENEIKGFIISSFFQRNNPHKELMVQLLKKCKPYEDGFKILKTDIFLYKNFHFRDFLKDLSFLVTTDEYYTLNTGFLTLYEKFYPPKNIEKIFESNELKIIIGELAEKEILEYENRRLKNFPKLIKKIEHISIRDSSVGYDIVSFEDDGTKRYIEVKAFSSKNPQFFWTRNEIEKSRIERDKYFLYLIPHKGKVFDKVNIVVIQNPQKNVLSNENWTLETELIKVSKNEG
jgi:hypothetical protein